MAAKFQINVTKTGFNFYLVAGNGETIATSQTYKTLTSCKKGIASVAANAPTASIEDQTKEGFEKAKNPKFELYADKKGEIRFRLKAKNGEIILASQGYKSIDSCKKGIASVVKNAASEIKVAECKAEAKAEVKPEVKKTCKKACKK